MSQQPSEYGIAPPLHESPRSPKWPWVLLLVAVLLAVGGLAFGSHVAGMLERTFTEQQQSSGPPPPPPPSLVPPPPPVSSLPPTRVVVFEVTGTGTAFNITATVGASVQNESSVRLPWTRTIEVPANQFTESVMLVVVAGPDGAEVHGKYTVDGTTVREGKASGPYGVLTITDR